MKQNQSTETSMCPANPLAQVVEYYLEKQRERERDLKVVPVTVRSQETWTKGGRGAPIESI